MQQNETPTPETGNEFYNQRLANMERLKEMGYEPFGHAFDRTGRLANIREQFEEGRKVRMAGRLVARREMGKSIFAHIQDGSDRFQLYMNRDSVGENGFAAFKVLDIGDQIGCEGELFITRTGEQTLKLHQWELLSKALRPLPEKWHGLQDVEARYRQRYLDLISNTDVRKRFDQRIAVIREIRRFLFERDFQEVETPMIQPMAGGAAATPFQTRYHALNADMYFRIAPELYLKRLLVGGFDKIFELNRNFRNEGLSRRHNPEFTMLEIYEAFGDVSTMKKLIQDMICHVATTVFGTLRVGSEERIIDLTPPWRSVDYNDLIIERAGPDWFDLSIEQARKRAETLGCEVDMDWSFTELTNEVYEKLIERTLINPTFVTRLPKELVPLAKRCSDNPDLVDVFELEIGGCEIAPGYTELNDPLDQRLRLEEQAAGDSSKMDEEFLLALEHGMPPAGGMGVGIDRLMMILTGAETIRDVILFPQLKPRNATE
ncbi:MAG: lysine--tRNA ligase [Kiritimatiellae bacterium]|nr:lysine--tRNA ligase [Kiritimatiellia bacterium]MDD4736047.1 lysine--tRNA ligase [Kiritimatiellia bacterium]